MCLRPCLLGGGSDSWVHEDGKLSDAERISEKRDEIREGQQQKSVPKKEGGVGGV